MGAFLDIQGAFDNVTPEGINKAMKRHNFPENVRKWYFHYLTNRYSMVEINGVAIIRQIMRGTPQGGILSPLIWNLVFNELLAMFGGTPVHQDGYADDLGLLVSGEAKSGTREMAGIMQQGINKAVMWGRENGLVFSPEKLSLVLFSRKFNTKFTRPCITIYGTKIVWENKVTYLGIILDQRLNWNANILEQSKKARGLLYQIRTSTRSL